MRAGRWRDAEPLPALALGTIASAFALTDSPAVRYGMCGVVCLLPLLQWVLSRTHRWIILFFAATILLPPLPFRAGDSGPHPALLFAGIGVLAGILAMGRWQSVKGPLPLVFVLFTAFVVGSVGVAAIYSGSTIALASLARALLFAIGPYIFLYTWSIPSASGPDAMRTTRLLFRLAILGGLFACVDFHFQLPPPAGYEPQFIWLGELVMRRAQGLFYEASTLGNFCAFFLVMILAALAGRKENRLCSVWELGAGGIVFAIALAFSYSRASLLNLVCAGLAMLYMQRANVRWMFAPVLCVMIAALSIYLILPDFAHGYWLRMEGSLFNLSATPSDVLSGRVSSWAALRDFILQQPWHLVLGIGYKTLPYSEFAGRQIIADNTYLDLLVETSVFGLALFIGLNVYILHAGIRAVRSPNARARFFGRWITCFWIGELVQMFFGDLITYWRVLPIYFWVLATAIRETQSEQMLEK